MGQYFVLANTDKKEYIDPGDFGENVKGSCFPNGGWIHIHGLALLVCRTDQIQRRPNHWGPLAGYWAGDNIVAIGDKSPEPNIYGIDTYTQGYLQSLSDFVLMEYGNISHKIILMFCSDYIGLDDDYDEEDFIPMIVKASRNDSSVLRTLGSAVFVGGCQSLEKELLRQWGPGWVDKYHQKMESWGKLYRLG